MSAGIGARNRPSDRGSGIERSGDVEALAEGILHEARSEAARVVAEARSRSEARVEAAKAQAARIAEESEAAAARQASAIAREADAKLAAELSRSELASREAAWKALVSKALELCREDARKPEFRKTLARLAAEAAIGLGGGEARARLGGSGGPPLDEALLREAERIALEASGIETRLAVGEPFADGNPGVALESADGRMSFDNRLEARFSRLEGELRARILRLLFDDADSESGVAGNGRVGT